MEVTPLEKVFVTKGSLSSSSPLRYHVQGTRFYDGRFSRCGIVYLAEAVAMTEMEAINNRYLPCGRCWFRHWRERAKALLAMQKEATGGL